MSKRVFSSFVVAAAAALLMSQRAEAASIIYNFNCIAQGTTCTPSASYGTLTLAETLTGGDITLTVELAGTGEKFKDLFLNFDGLATKITATGTFGGTNLLDLNSVSHAPYQGNFDIGPLDGNDPFTATLSGWNAGGTNVDLHLSDFDELDTLNHVFAAIHIQNIGPNGCKAEGPVVCTPGTTGEGSMNAVGATFDAEINRTLLETPEPASLVLLASGLVLSMVRLLRKS